MRHQNPICAICLGRPSSHYRLMTDQFNQCKRGKKVLNVLNDGY